MQRLRPVGEPGRDMRLAAGLAALAARMTGRPQRWVDFLAEFDREQPEQTVEEMQAAVQEFLAG